MARVLTVSGSPSPTSRTTALLRHLGNRLTGQGHEVTLLEVRSLPAQALLGADLQDDAVRAAAGLFEAADGIVVATPVYKAAYSGLLKSMLDVLPQNVLAGKVVLPLATGGSTAHLLAIDYALRPVLASMGAGQITPGRFTVDQDITVLADGTAAVAEEAGSALAHVADQFSAALGGRTVLSAASV